MVVVLVIDIGGAGSVTIETESHSPPTHFLGDLVLVLDFVLVLLLLHKFDFELNLDLVFDVLLCHQFWL